MSYKEAFSVANQSASMSTMITLSVIGGILIVFELALLFVRRKYGEESEVFIKPNNLTRVGYPTNRLLIVAGGLLLLVGLYDYSSKSSSLAKYREELTNSNAQFCEGQVTVINTQPYEGHSKGDIVRIGDKEFVLNYFLNTSYYHQTISHGGVLKTNSFVRIQYLPTNDDEALLYGEGKILRIELQSE